MTPVHVRINCVTREEDVMTFSAVLYVGSNGVAGEEEEEEEEVVVVVVVVIVVAVFLLSSSNVTT